MKLKKSINIELQKKLRNVFFIGRLVNENDLSTTLIPEPVYFKDEFSEDIQFHVKCLSPIPDELRECFLYSNDIITGSTISNNNRRKLNEFMGYEDLHHFEKKEKVREFLENKLIVFQLTIKPEVIYVEIVIVEDILPSDKGYVLIPSPELKNNETIEDFEEKIVGVRKPFSLPLYPNILPTPEFIYYQNTIYQVLLKKTLNVTTYFQDDSEEVKYYSPIDEFFTQNVVARIDDRLYFFPVEKLVDLRDYLEKKESLNQKYKSVKNTENKDGTEILGKSIILVERKNELSNFNKSEVEFLELLEQNAHKRGLHYNRHDLYSFHISVKTNLLTIIGGMSGTGKSQLAKLYGETMGLQYGEELLMIPVSPSYHEPNDILGYLNPTTGVYHESETGLVDLLLKAEESPDRMYMVVFDEMNLSQVEHWFSPFISLLEIEENNRYLSLFNEGSYSVNPKYKPKIKIGDNIIFVGTINFDETTKDFSDRLLDRINVITPKKMSFMESINVLKTQDEISEQIESMDIHRKLIRDKWLRKKNKKDVLTVLSEDEIQLLDQIHEMLNKEDRQKGISFRVVLGIASFIANIPVKEDNTMLIDRRIAFDIQLAQRVLTKINGVSTFVEPLVGRFEDGVFKPGAISRLLQSEEGQKVSDFSHSLDYLKSKAKELDVHGYAI